MNIALILAGGVGQRMSQDVPKQFLSVHDKPIIIYTLESFQRHPQIDKIAVVCLEGWHDALKAYAKQFNIDKLEIVCGGGKSGQESIRCGLEALRDVAAPDDVILIHDGIRPLVGQEIITDCIGTALEFGNAIPVIPCNEAMLVDLDDHTSKTSIPRSTLKRTQTPHGMRYRDLLELHQEAEEKGITSSVATCTLLIELGRAVHYSRGSEKNLKLTTVEDLDIFKALLEVEHDPWIKGC